MNTWWWLAIGFPAGIAAVWILMRRKPVAELDFVPRAAKKSGPVEVKRNEPRKYSHHYYGVSIQPDNHPCEAIKAIADQRFLSEDAPRLPLPECDRTECRCVLRPQDDRRAGYDRRGDSFSAYGNFELDRHTQKRHDQRDRRDS